MFRGISAYFLVFFIVFVWCFLILLTPLLVDKNPAFASSLYSFFRFFCHQIPSHSLSFSELTLGIIQVPYKLPVCTRDTAFYLALLVGIIAYPHFPWKNKSNTQNVPSLIWLIIAAIPMAVDGGTQALGWRESTNLLRVVTGALLGFVAAYYLIPLVNRLGNKIRKKK